MLRSNSLRLRRQVRFLRRQFSQEGELPFTDLLTNNTVIQALTDAEVVLNDLIYTPLVTLWIFFEPGSQRRSFLSRRCRTPHRLSSFAGTICMLTQD